MPPPLPQTESEKLAKTVNLGIKIWLGCLGTIAILMLLVFLFVGGACAAGFYQAQQKAQTNSSSKKANAQQR